MRRGSPSEMGICDDPQLQKLMGLGIKRSLGLGLGMGCSQWWGSGLLCHEALGLTNTTGGPLVSRYIFLNMKE